MAIQNTMQNTAILRQTNFTSSIELNKYANGFATDNFPKEKKTIVFNLKMAKLRLLTGCCHFFLQFIKFS